MNKKTKVYIRESSEYKTIHITSLKPSIDDDTIELWQDIVNIISNLFNLASTVITLIKEDALDVFIASDNLDNPLNETVSLDLGTVNYFEDTLGLDKAVFIKNADRSKFKGATLPLDLNLISYYGLPLKWPDGQFFGTISVLNSNELVLTESLKLMISTYKNTIESRLELLKIKQELNNITYRDALTGVYNRRKIKEYQLHEFEIARRGKSDFSILLVDLDRFSLINESYGYEYGDTVLKFFSDLILSRLRLTDYLGRWNGDNFIVVCPNTNFEGAQVLKYDIINEVQNHSVSTIPELSCSIGIAEYSYTDEDSYDMIKRADIDLFRQKDSK